METVRESAKAYEPKKTMNIAELEKVPVDSQIFIGEGTRKDGTPFKYRYINFNDQEYRVPESVRKALKDILKAKPSVMYIKVTKQGEGINSSYTVINL